MGLYTAVRDVAPNPGVWMTGVLSKNGPPGGWGIGKVDGIAKKVRLAERYAASAAGERGGERGKLSLFLPDENLGEANATNKLHLAIQSLPYGVPLLKATAKLRSVYPMPPGSAPPEVNRSEYPDDATYETAREAKGQEHVRWCKRTVYWFGSRESRLEASRFHIEKITPEVSRELRGQWQDAAGTTGGATRYFGFLSRAPELICLAHQVFCPELAVVFVVGVDKSWEDYSWVVKGHCEPSPEFVGVSSPRTGLREFKQKLAAEIKKYAVPGANLLFDITAGSTFLKQLLIEAAPVNSFVVNIDT